MQNRIKSITFNNVYCDLWAPKLMLLHKKNPKSIYHSHSNEIIARAAILQCTI